MEEEHADKSRIAVCVRRSPAAHQILETISIELRLRLPHSIFPIIFSSGECVFLDISFHVFQNDVLQQMLAFMSHHVREAPAFLEEISGISLEILDALFNCCFSNSGNVLEFLDNCEIS